VAPGKRTDGARGDRRIAAILFAAHPAAFDGVAWISSLSNIGLPLMLGSWLAFARGTTSDQVQWRAVWVSALLLGFALGFRESTLVVAGAMAVWRLVWWRRHRLRAWSSYAPLVPLAAVVVAYELIRTRFLTEPAANSEVWDPGMHIPGQFWYYLKVTTLPVSPGSTGLAHWLQVAAGAIAFGALPVLLLFRRWLIGALVAGVLVSIAPYAPLTLAVLPRYGVLPGSVPRPRRGCQLPRGARPPATAPPSAGPLARYGRRPRRRPCGWRGLHPPAYGGVGRDRPGGPAGMGR